MTTTELTGAEDVAWDLSDLYESGDDARLEQDVQEAEEASETFRETYYGKVADLDAAGLAAAIAERERIESIFTRAIYYAHLWFSTDTADPARGALVARLTEKGAALDTQLLFFGLEIADLDDDRADALIADSALEHWQHWLRSLRKFRPYLLSEPEEKIFTEKSVSGVSAWSRLHEELLSAVKVEIDGEEISFEKAMSKLYSADRDERRTAAEAVTEALAPGPAHEDVRLQHDPRRQVDRRSPARIRDLDLVTQPPQRHDRRGGTGARRRGSLALRRTAALLPAEGEARRPRSAHLLRPLRADRGRSDLGVLGRGQGHRPRGVSRLRSRGGRHRRAFLHRELDRRADPREQAHRRVLRHQRPRRAPVHPHELHGRPPLDPDPGARARPRPARLARRSRSGSSTPTLR